MIPLSDSLPLVKYNNKVTVELDEGWITESIFQAAARTGRSRWWAEQITSGLFLFLEHDVREQEVDCKFLEESIRIILHKLNASEVCAHFHLLPPNAVISLELLAESSATSPCELHFFTALREILTSRISSGFRCLHLCDLRKAVFLLSGTQTWRKKCTTTKKEILYFITHQAIRINTPHHISIIVT
jgi:hypothetical protein